MTPNDLEHTTLNFLHIQVKLSRAHAKAITYARENLKSNVHRVPLRALDFTHTIT